MFLTVFFQMLALSILIGSGAYMYRKDYIDDHATKKISAMITHVFNPMLMLSSAMDAIGSVDRASWFTLFGISLVIFFILVLLSFAALPFFEKDKHKKALMQLMLIFGNLGFMGIPVVKGVYGAEYAVYVLTFMISFNIIFYTFGLLVFTGKLEAAAILQMFNPGTLACGLSILLLLFEPALPVFVTLPVKYLGDVCSPLAMLIVGVSVARSDLRRIFTNRKLFLFTLYRMILLPLACIPILRLLPINDILRGICLIEISMPVANIVLAVGIEKGLDTDDCSACIIMTTLLSVLTLPLIIMLL